MSSRNRNNYIEHELTDDEDSGSEGYMDDMRSFRGRRESSARSSTSRRGRRNSTQSSIDLDDDCENRNGNRNSVKVASNRDRRAGSLARSVQSGWSTKPATKSASSNRSQEPIVSDRNDRRKVDSPSQTQDSESEPGTKALVQAKIREKLAQQSSLDESSSDFWKPKNSKNPKGVANKFQSRVESESQTNDRPIQAANTFSTEPIERERSMQSANANAPDPIEREKSVQLAKPTESVERDILQIIEQDNINVHSEIDVGPLGPPPSAPEYDWECEFCTFVNEAKTKICTICCKTPMSIPQKKLSASEPIKSAEPPIESTSIVVNEVIRKSTTASSSEDTNKESNNVGKSKGKSRKISFWPGTKST